MKTGMFIPDKIIVGKLYLLLISLFLGLGVLEFKPRAL